MHSLNTAQQEAVCAPLGHQLVLAGAGSGKTRVLIHRIAWLIENENISPFNILAVTFTNKAANEMRARIENKLGKTTNGLWIGTFHSLSHRFLRLHWQEAGLNQAFQILDADDQFRLIRRITQGMNLDENRFAPKDMQWFINKQKEEGLEPHQVDGRDVYSKKCCEVYYAYQDTCQRAGLLDFADLLLKTYQLLHNHNELRMHYQTRFRCLLVDEFQDTNAIQYAWLKIFTGETSSLMIVGDDDQSIYGWRGARIENIQRFSNDFPSAKIIRLEQNYRSSGTILKAANALIAKNAGRLGKNLWTDGQDGELITLYAGFNETDEAFFIVNRIRTLQQKYQLKDFAVLYRSNAQSRVLEEALMQFGIPYRVYGGLRYFDRQEIKDALAYLRLVNNPADDASFERIVNTPTRGIGDRTIDAIREHAKKHGMTLWQALHELLELNYFATRAATALQSFSQLIGTMQENIANKKLDKQVEYIVHASQLMAHYRKEKGEKGLTRLENLEELVNAAYQFSQDGIANDMPPLVAFLAYAALESSDDQANAYEDSIQLMTLHSAKGLEFPVVFLAGCEEELFPHFLSISDPKALEEERRLCYVGITRAMQKLFMTYAEVRRTYGKEVYHKPSRFLREIPEKLIDTVRFKTKINKVIDDGKDQHPFYTGRQVHHNIFGSGIVLDCEGEGEDLKVKVRFPTVGTKLLIASYLTAK